MEERLIKDQVIAWVVTQEPWRSAKGEKTLLSVKPLAVDWSGEFDSDVLTLSEEEAVVAVVPALPGSYEVWGVVKESDACERLGYEMPGATCPDWDKELQSLGRRKVHAAPKKV